MKRIDRVVISLILFCLIILTVIIWFGSQTPVDVVCQSSSGCDKVSPLGALTFTFSRPVDSSSVESAWVTDPLIEGKWTWTDPQHAHWNSLKPLPSNKGIKLTLKSSRIGQNGESLNESLTWNVEVRKPDIVMVKEVGQGQELFVVNLDGGEERRLTDTDGRVFDYEISPDGETILFSVVNAQRGIDFWSVHRDGTGQTKVLDCGGDRCSTPAWSHISQELAYTRVGPGLTPEGSLGQPRIWILDMKTGQTSQLFKDSRRLGYGAVWSPDGQWLSIWDELEGGILIVNRQSGETILLSSGNGDTGCWSPDSQYLYYANILNGEAGFRNVIYRMVIEDRVVSTAFGGNIEGGGLSMEKPVCSPVDDWLAVSIQPAIKIPGRELHLLNPDVKDGIVISEDLTRIPGFYSWTPSGDRLLYQLSGLGSQFNDRQIWVWERATHTQSKIVEDASNPRWLP